MAEPADLNLDELKRRGRRRLIGAIVLALVAAVVVPMLLESEPRPLGEDVSVRIPPVDEGKYVSKIAEGRTKQDAAKPATRAPAPAAPPGSLRVAASRPARGRLRPDTAPVPATPPVQDAAPRKSLADAEKAMLAPGAGATSAPPKSNGNGAKAADTAKAAEPAAAKSPAPARAEAPSKPPDSTAPSTREGFAVQLAAFSDDKGANALSNKLKRAGYPAFTEAISTSRGTLWRVRVGPYPTREAAAQSRDKLKAEGHAGIVVPAK
ncbi:MAG: SPOR domain-containing protein [Betaproteobacteria bacterium]|nr:SPOR domain-containing protein [Betaproteobacteria bacterium]